MRPKPWLIYALGGGLGHLTRSLALARQANQQRPISLITNSPFANQIPWQLELSSRDQIICLSADASREEVATKVRSLLQLLDFDTIIVDTFPRGLAGELAEILPQLSCKKVFVHRDLNPEYVKQFQLCKFVRHYDLMLSPGEQGPITDHPHHVQTAPWLIRNHSEMLSRKEARKELHADNKPLVVLLATGKTEEIAWMQQLAETLQDRYSNALDVRLVGTSLQECLLQDHTSSPTSLSPSIQTISKWPLFSLFYGIDLLVGSGGYNTVYEARVTGIPFFAFAQERLYDRQRKRLRAEEMIESAEDLFAKIDLWLEQYRGLDVSIEQPSASPSFPNGVATAVEEISQIHK